MVELRRRIGMVFQKPNPFPKSIYENIAYGLRIHGLNIKDTIDEIVESSLKKPPSGMRSKIISSRTPLPFPRPAAAALYCRTLATQPEVILFDEPCSALDPISTAKIEELIHHLKQNYTIVIVTHNMQQAARVSDYSGFSCWGS